VWRRRAIRKRRESRNEGETVQIEVETASNTQVVGIQHGLDEEKVEAFLDRHDERLAQSLLQALRPELLREYQSDDAAARSLYVCSSGGSRALGFSVNNSGLLLCPAGIGPADIGSVGTADALVGSDPHAEKSSWPYVTVAVGQLLRAVQIDTPTAGLVPAYNSRLENLSGEQLFALGEDGTRVSLQLDVIELWMRIQTPAGEVEVDGCIGLTKNLHPPLIGGPILTARDEVLAVSIAQSQSDERGYVYGRPWSSLETCIVMGSDPEN
jgi:hypothetical protein